MTFKKVSYPREIENRLNELGAAMYNVKARASKLKIDDPYEWLVIAQTEELSRKIESTKRFTTKFIEKMKGSDPEAAKILDLMAEGSIKEKKKELLRLIKQYPVLATSDFGLMYQRIAYFKLFNAQMNQIPLPATPIKDTIDKLEQEENAPKDDDFLE